MKRSPSRLADERFDLLLIGGGVTGACIARDAAMRGLSVALVEKGDFANATSAHNTKLIHGGLRYLRNFELGLVRESLKERRIWQRIAPHLVNPLPFLVPVYDGGFKGRATLAAGLTLYDLLSYDRGWLDDPAQRLPGHTWLSRSEALALEPALDAPGFEGAFRYYDAQMYSPERLALENVLDADGHGAALANYVTAEKLLLREGRVEGASVRDAVTGDAFDIRAALTIVCAGPWADIFLAQALHHPASHKLLRSKGIHLLVPPIVGNEALAVAAEGGHFFVVPWRGVSLLGTTDTAYPGDPDAVGVSEADIAGLLGFINKHLPAAHLKRGDVKHFYAGLRPLVDDKSGSTYGASRKAEMIDHAKDDKVEGLFSVIGGKWTTSRDLAEKVVNCAVTKLGKTANPCATGTTLLPGGVAMFSQYAKQHAKAELPDMTHLLRLYGKRHTALFAEAGNRPELLKPISPYGDIGAQVTFAIREEAALTLEDIVMRRTGIGQLGNPGNDALEYIADIAVDALGWSETQRNEEIEAVKANFLTRDDAA